MKVLVSILSVFLAALVVCSCTPPPQVWKASTDGPDYKIVHIEGCEYVVIYAYRGESITHKGDCSNPIHIYQQSEGESQ